METRLINQVVVWERILEMENEKQKNLRPKAPAYTTAASGPCRKEHKSSLSKFMKLALFHNNTSHSSELA